MPVEHFLEPVRQNAVGERRARKASAIVRLRSERGWRSLVDPARPVLVPALHSTSVDGVSQGAQGLGIRGVRFEGLAQQLLGALVLDQGLPEPGRAGAQ